MCIRDRQDAHGCGGAGGEERADDVQRLFGGRFVDEDDIGLGGRVEAVGDRADAQGGEVSDELCAARRVGGDDGGGVAEGGAGGLGGHGGPAAGQQGRLTGFAEDAHGEVVQAGQDLSVGVHDGEVGVRGPLPQPAKHDMDMAGPRDGGVHAEFAQGQRQEAVRRLAVGAGQQYDQGVQGTVEERGVEHDAVERGTVGQFEGAEGLPVTEPDLGEGAHAGAVVQAASVQDVVAVGVGDQLGAAGGDGGRIGRCRGLDGTGVDLAGRDHALAGGEFEPDGVALSPQLDQRGARAGGVGEQLLERDSAQPDRSAEGEFAGRAGQFQLSGGGQDGLGVDTVVGQVELGAGA